MKVIQEGDVSISVDENGDVLLIGKATLPINKENAKRIFGGGLSSDPNDGLFPLIAGDKKICLSVMPDYVAKLALTVEQV